MSELTRAHYQDSRTSLPPRWQRHSAILAASLSALMLGACSQSGAQLDSLLGSPSSESTSVASATANGKPVSPQTELEKATEYWGKKYKESPKNLEAGLSFAKNLKALGEKRQALAVLQQVSVHHSKDRELASEYGRLALELDQVGIAKTMLAMADDPANPDWRVISARGTVLAKEGKYTEAIPVFERAMTLAPDQTSVMNNLAMAYAMGGEAARAEELLRKIEVTGGNSKVRQNLALVVGLQGKFDEAKSIAAQEIGQDGAAANASVLRQFVKGAPSGGPAVAGWRASATGGAGKAKSNAAPEAIAIDAENQSPGTYVAPVSAVVTEPVTTTPVSRIGGNDAPLLKGMTR